jgi:hypothetical protein
MVTNLRDRASLRCELAAEVVQNFGEARLQVTGASMLPTVWPGDVVFVQRRALRELQPGQILLAYRNGALIAHRIKSIAGDRLITQGDSLPHSDPPVTSSELVGQVVSILRGGRDVPLKQSHWRRVLSAILRRSDFCLRMTLRAGRRWHRLRNQELVWAR